LIADGPCRSIEDREDVALVGDAQGASAEARRVVHDQAPHAVERLRRRGGLARARAADGLDAQQRHEHASGIGPGPSGGEETADVIQQRILIADKRQIIVAGKLDDRGVGNQAYRTHPLAQEAIG
jgi:hypothetical protein